MKKIYLLLMLTFLLVGCNEQNVTVNRESESEINKLYFEDGKTLYYEGEVRDEKPHGKGIEYNRNGSIKFEGEFQNGEIYEGKGYRGGKLFYEGRFEDGIPYRENVSSQKDLRAEADEETRKLNLRNVEPQIGMTKDDVLLTKWGKPEDINRTTTRYSVSEQWVYSGYRYIYFEDGIVTAIQE